MKPQPKVRAKPKRRDGAATLWRWYLLPLTPYILFTFTYRWIEEGATLTEINDIRISMLITMALCIALFSAVTLWKFLCAAHYQRQLDELDRYSQ